MYQKPYGKKKSRIKKKKKMILQKFKEYEEVNSHKHGYSKP